MSYNITTTNGEIIKELEENVIDFDTVSSIGLIGKLSPNYGETQSNNFVHLAENFANTSEPESPLLGMTYYNTEDNAFYICTALSETGNTWTKMCSIFIKTDSSTEMPKNPQNGDMYYDIESKQLYVYDTTIGDVGEWVLIGPDNYNHKKKYSELVQTSYSMPEATYEIEFDANTSNLVIMKIVGSEKIDEDSSIYGTREPETAAWIYKVLVNTYSSTNGVDYAKIIGAPIYEMIGRTDGAEDWTSTVEIKDNRLLLTLNGAVSSKNSSIDWEVETEILKA